MGYIKSAKIKEMQVINPDNHINLSFWDLNTHRNVNNQKEGS